VLHVVREREDSRVMPDVLVSQASVTNPINITKIPLKISKVATARALAVDGVGEVAVGALDMKLRRMPSGKSITAVRRSGTVRSPSTGDYPSTRETSLRLLRQSQGGKGKRGGCHSDKRVVGGGRKWGWGSSRRLKNGSGQMTPTAGCGPMFCFFTSVTERTRAA